MAKSPDLEKQTMNFRRGDWDFLTSICTPNGIPVSHFVRELVAKKVDELRRRDLKVEINLDE